MLRGDSTLTASVNIDKLQLIERAVCGTLYD